MAAEQPISKLESTFKRSAAVLKKAGARAVFATDLNEERLELARQMGADLAIDAREDVVGRLRTETEGDGVDMVLEMSGSSAALHQGLAVVTNGGRVSLLGTHSVPATIDAGSSVPLAMTVLVMRTIGRCW